MSNHIPPEGTELIANPEGEEPYVVGVFRRCQSLRNGGCTMYSPLCIDCLEITEEKRMKGQADE